LHDPAGIKNALASSTSHHAELAAYYFASVDLETRKATEALSAARREYVELEEAQAEIPVMRESTDPRATYILARGAYDAPKSDANRVACDTPSKILIPFPSRAPRNRLGLAQWLTDPRHPLTA